MRGSPVSSPNQLAHAVRSRGTARQNTSSLRRGMYQLKLMPQLLCGVAGSRSCDSGIASSAVQPSASSCVAARHTGFHVASRALSVSSVWIQSARTPAAVTAKL